MGSILAILTGLCIVALLKLVGKSKNANQDAENAEMSDFYGLDDDRVSRIVKTAYLDLKRQRAGSHGPWLESLLDGPLYLQYDERGGIQVRALTKSISPGVALSAITMTIQEILSAPISYDKDGREMPRRVFNLDGLHKAEEELMEMMGEGE